MDFQVVRIRRVFDQGPIHGSVGFVEAEGIQLNLAWRDPETGRGHHYRLAEPLPQTSAEPLQLRYLYVGEFDFAGDYVEGQGLRDLEEINERLRKNGGGGSAS